MLNDKFIRLTIEGDTSDELISLFSAAVVNTVGSILYEDAADYSILSEYSTSEGNTLEISLSRDLTDIEADDICRLLENILRVDFDLEVSGDSIN
tara:strand:- start:1225 stop:1509 length:285 start_codon:yes stop_codon:yes gene_type:complete